MINYTNYCKYKTLSKPEQKEIFKEIIKCKNQIKKGKEKIVSKHRIIELNNKIVCSYIPLVIKLVQKYKLYPEIDLDDLLHEGILGLYYALDKFQYKRNNKFSTYAIPWVKLKIQLASKNHYALNISPYFLRKLKKYKDTEETLKKDVINLLDKKYPISYISFQDNISDYNSKHSSYGGNNKEISLQEVIDNNIITPRDILEKYDTFIHVEKAIKTLKDDEQYIIRNRYGFDGDKMTLEEIGKKLKLSREMIFAKEKEILNKLSYRIKL